MLPDDPPPPSARLASAPATTAARAGGAALGAATKVLAAIRNSPKPLHPRGHHVHATVTRTGSPTPSGVPWLDEPGTNEVVVRHSAAIGIPLGLPDIQGIAVQVATIHGPAHLLFATTGLGALTRYLLTTSSRIDGRPYTTLLPYRTPTGPVVLGLKPHTATRMALMWAHGYSAWYPFATLDLGDRYDGAPISFDPMLQTLPGLEPYPWVRALRSPAYRVARQHRGDTQPEAAPGGASDHPQAQRNCDNGLRSE